MNILISSAGRRVSLYNSFFQEIKSLKLDSKIYCADNKPNLSSACQLSGNYFEVPRLNHPEFINVFLSECIKRNIKIVIPTIDTELMILSENRALFEDEGISVIVSEPNLINEANSKLLSKELFERNLFNYPKILDKSSLQFPLIAKPEFGSSSKDITIVRQKENFNHSLIENRDLLFFEFLPPEEYSEFTVDLYYDKSSILKCAVPRERLETRGGEVSKGVTRKNRLYFSVINNLSTLEGARGCLTFQFFVSNKNENVYGIECNPRFGGGYPLSYHAGANFPNWILKEYILNEKIEFFSDWEENLLMLRYDCEVLTHNFK